MRKARRLLLVALALVACSRRARVSESPSASDKAFVTLERVEGRTEPSGTAPVSKTLLRGAELKVLGAQGDYFHVTAPGGGEVWVPSGSFERESEREARTKRAAAVAAFPEQPGRLTERCPVLWAPEYGAARWGELGEGEDVRVLLADHDFFGIRFQGSLAFVPARSVLLLPPPSPTRLPAPTPTAFAPPAGEAATPVLPEPGAVPPPEPAEPLAALPPGADPPVLVTRVDPRYPELAKRNLIEGEVVLRIVVEADGSVGRVDVVTKAPGGLSEAATDAVRRWRYQPARVNGRAVAVYKLVKVRFTLSPAGP